MRRRMVNKKNPEREAQMSYAFFNANPAGNMTSDCVIRAISLVTGMDWDTIYMRLMLKGYELKVLPDVNQVWGAFLKENGFVRYVIPNTCPDCYTIADFVKDNPQGTFLVATDAHVVGVKDGKYYDTSDCGKSVPIYYWKKEAR